ncbi:MAG: NfeD family protein [Candidatus Thermoplasmatota archaeon]|nr:NfeD family protein [Candidatus Thermoplasmatota archaeon]
MPTRNSARAYFLKESAEFVVLVSVLAVVSRFVRIPMWVLVGVPLGKILVSSAMYVLFLRRSFLYPARVGPEALIGLTAEAITPLNPSGQIKINGEIWSAFSQNGTTIPSQQKVRILEAHGNTLYVVTLT